jgi:hypothetical protein
MSASTNLPQALQASLNQARANIPLAHYEVPEGVVLSPDSAFIHINPEESIHLLVERLRTVKRRRKLENVVRHRFGLKSGYKTMPDKHRLL